MERPTWWVDGVNGKDLGGETAAPRAPSSIGDVTKRVLAVAQPADRSDRQLCRLPSTSIGLLTTSQVADIGLPRSAWVR